jgi:hypothetical protein
MTNPTAKPREYKRFAPNLGTSAHVRHGRDTNETHERVRRPADATPRKTADWR